MTKFPRKNVPDVGIVLGTACMPSGHASNRATAPGKRIFNYALNRESPRLKNWQSESDKYSKHIKHLYKSITWSACANVRNPNKKIGKRAIKLIGIECFCSDGI